MGDARSDHTCWERPEDMDTPRNVYKIEKNNPGSDVAAETAAALAAASLVFKKSDPSYSKTLVTRATRVWTVGYKLDSLLVHVYGFLCDKYSDLICLLWV